MADIFISYSSEDLDRVKPLATALEEQGWSVWWDRRIIIGQSFEEIIEEAIDDANCVISVWSSCSINSKWVRAEAAEGFRRQILAPILIEEVKLPLLYRQLQTASLIGWDGSTSHSGFKQLIRDLIEMLGMPPKPTEIIDQNNEIDDIEQNGDAPKQMKIIDQGEAVDDVKKAREWFEKGNSLDRSKQYQDAIFAFDKALEIYPNYAQAWCNKGLSLKRLGRYEEAIAAYDKALEINPGYIRAWNNKGDAHKKFGRNREARAAYKKARMLEKK